MIYKLSKTLNSLIRSLSFSKYRQKHQLFVAEGQKIVNELLNSEYKIRFLIFNVDKAKPKYFNQFEVYECRNDEMKKISNLKNPPSVIAVAEIPKLSLKIEDLRGKLTLSIEEIQDPGNLGTIVRICSWFGIENLICSKNSTDIYNPKAIQATMGAFTKLKVHYTEFNKFLTEYSKIIKHEIFGTFLEGENIYKSKLPQNALIILGNEGHGISKQTASLINKKLFIPPYNIKNHPESLNISSAAAILCSEFRRYV